MYLNGESFQPTCKLQCICMDGAIGCIPLCSDDLRLPSPECPKPRRVKFHNKRCEEWVCEEGSEDNRFGTAMAGENVGETLVMLCQPCPVVAKNTGVLPTPFQLPLHSTALEWLLNSSSARPNTK